MTFRKPLHLVNSGASPNDVHDFFRMLGSQDSQTATCLNGFEVEMVGGMQMKVFPGAGILPEGYYVTMTASEQASVVNHDGGPPRWDLLCVTVDDSVYGSTEDRARLSIVTGAYSSSPSYGTLPVRSMVIAGLQVNTWGDITIHDARTRKLAGYYGKQTKFLPGLGSVLTYDQPSGSDGRLRWDPSTGKLTFSPIDGTPTAQIYPQVGEQTVKPSQLDATTIWNPLWDGWKTYNPTWTNLPRSHTSVGRYRIQGYTVDFMCTATLGSAVESPAPTVAPFFTFPATTQTGTGIVWSGSAVVLDNTDPPAFCAGVWSNISGAQGRVVGATPLQDPLYGVLSSDIGTSGQVIVNGRYRRATATAGSLA